MNLTPIIILISIALIILAYFIGKNLGSRIKEIELERARKDAIQRSRAVLTGQFTEQLAPILPNFNYNPTECKFIGKPIDFLVFKGLDKKDIEEVVFLEVKTQNSKLSETEKSLKGAIQNKRVSWEEYRI